MARIKGWLGVDLMMGNCYQLFDKYVHVYLLNIGVIVLILELVTLKRAFFHGIYEIRLCYQTHSLLDYNYTKYFMNG